MAWVVKPARCQTTCLFCWPCCPGRREFLKLLLPTPNHHPVLPCNLQPQKSWYDQECLTSNQGLAFKAAWYVRALIWWSWHVFCPCILCQGETGGVLVNWQCSHVSINQTLGGWMLILIIFAICSSIMYQYRISVNVFWWQLQVWFLICNVA